MERQDLLSALQERGFIQKTTDDESDDKPLRRLLDSKRVTGYIGFDPTAESLHVGNLVAIMGLVHLQRCGHRPLAIVGGATGMVGDPSGKTEMRKVLGLDDIRRNLEGQKRQLSRYLDILADEERDAAKGQGSSPDDTRGTVLNNADWLLPLRYIEFLRDVGRHFSVNRMLAAESVQLRLQSDAGLSFLEFNYSLLQAYDFLVLHDEYDCELQMGGSDQWGNIVAGADLIRRVRGRRAHGITFPLITTAGGRKMGKSEKGAVWLDPERTSPYEYYQYWINTDDRDVGRFLRLFTLLPMERIRELDRLEGKDLRQAKEVLALEATALTHGREEAEKARAASESLFGGPGGSGGAGGPADADVPSYAVTRSELEKGVLAVNLFASAGLCESRSAARRLARQNGLYLEGASIAEDRVLTLADLREGAMLLRAGKKRYVRIVPEEG